MSTPLFSPCRLRGLELANRIVISPMCQYSAEDGSATDWHIMHLGTLAGSGAGLVIIEATGVEAAGRITPGCVGLYSDANEAALARAVAACRRWGSARIGIQLGHAGRKASSKRPWESKAANEPLESGAWTTSAPSALPFGPGWHVPEALTTEGLKRIRTAFVDAARRADRIGIELAELHGAHGYLLHQFLSPVSNKRTDAYGGSLENRMRFPLEVFEAVRAVWPAEKPLGMRISAVDWIDGGWGLEDTIAFAGRLKALGCDFVDASSGGNDPAIKVPFAPGYQVPFASAIRERTGLPTMAVGLITDPAHANTIVAKGEADMVALARAFLDDPHWGWHAAYALGAEVEVPPQYRRATLKTWAPAKAMWTAG